MKILCKIREVDNIVWFRGTKYVFRKTEGADGLVCDVDDEDAVKYILLSGPEFSLMSPEAAFALDEIKADMEEKKRRSEETSAKAKYARMTLQELHAVYRAKYGKAAHPSSKHETLVERLSRDG